jgi:hypothetical protein
VHIPVLIEPVPGNGYRVKGSEPFAYTVEGATQEEALEKLREMIKHRLASGMQVVALEIPPGEQRRVPPGGDLQDDPMLEEWQQAMAEYRKGVDADTEAP